MKAAALLLLVAAAAVPALAGQARGHLLIVGGGSQPDALVTRFVELAGGRGRARIAVVPMASEEPRETGEEKAVQLREFGADAVVLNLTRAEAADSAVAARLEGITGIWFTGGDQVPLVAALGGTAALAAMQRRYRAGAVVGGTSAGAAIMGDSMLTGNQRRPDSLGYYGDEYPEIARRTIEVVPGLGFLPAAIVDQHFLRRERQNRLLAVILERPGFLGVGIDEGTAVEVGPDGRWRVLGRSSVVVYDARRAGRGAPDGALGGTDIRLHVLPPGSTFDPRTGRGHLPGAAAVTGSHGP
ncbi:MAG: cyanophycinase [Gemmatimonadetes bacterium]|nr:cyanophycinase [Gemmatimonadota bacterium]